MKKLIVVAGAIAAAMTVGAMHSASAQTSNSVITATAQLPYRPNPHAANDPRKQPVRPTPSDHDTRRDPDDRGSHATSYSVPSRVGAHVVETTVHRVTPPLKHAKKHGAKHDSDGRDRR